MYYELALRIAWSFTISVVIAAGVTPDIRDAWPSDTGLARESFSFISLERLNTES